MFNFIIHVRCVLKALTFFMYIYMVTMDDDFLDFFLNISSIVLCKPQAHEAVTIFFLTM